MLCSCCRQTRVAARLPSKLLPDPTPYAFFYPRGYTGNPPFFFIRCAVTYSFSSWASLPSKKAFLSKPRPLRPCYLSARFPITCPSYDYMPSSPTSRPSGYSSFSFSFSPHSRTLECLDLSYLRIVSPRLRPRAPRARGQLHRSFPMSFLGRCFIHLQLTCDFEDAVSAHSVRYFPTELVLCPAFFPKALLTS